MATVKKLFSEALQQGMKAASGITDSYQRATAYAALADAMAKTGLVTGANLDEADASTATTAAPAAATEKGKDSLKPEATKTKTTPAPAPKKEEKVAEPEAAEEPVTEEEPELTEEWTDEMVQLKSEQIEFISQLKTDYEEAALNDCVQQFSENTMTSLDEITPLNIDAFVAFMQALINQQEG